MVTRKGQALRIPETDIRSMGRQAAGVTGIRLKEGDKPGIDGSDRTRRAAAGGHRTGIRQTHDLEEYPEKGRATGGVATIDQKNLPKIGQIASARVVQDDDEITIISSGGIMLRLKVKDISMSGRATRGFKLMDLGKEDSVASLARIATAEVRKNVNSEPEESSK